MSATDSPSIQSNPDSTGVTRASGVLGGSDHPNMSLTSIPLEDASSHLPFHFQADCKITSSDALVSGGDAISNLPDCVLSQILSLLPTKDAVRTSVLSKDWKYRWTLICNIDVNDEDQFSEKKSSKESFAKFVERVLLLTDDIQIFDFECKGKHGVGRVKTWISSVLGPKLCGMLVLYGESGIILPRKLLSCYLLKELVLMLPCTFMVPERVSFGSLTFLVLEGVTILNENSTADCVMFDFPVLVEFTLNNCKWLNVKSVEISAPKMATFDCVTPYDAVANNYSIKIIAESLKLFGSFGGLPENIVLSCSSAVEYAALENLRGPDDLDIVEEIMSRLLKWVTKFSNLKTLLSSYLLAKAIADFRQLVYDGTYRFNKLEELQVTSRADYLLVLLKASPSLKRLVIHLVDVDGFNYDVEEVPSCIKSHLEEFKFRQFSGKRYEYDLVKYILENGVKLRKLYITNYSGDWIPKNEIAEELSKYSKASTCLSVSIENQKLK